MINTTSRKCKVLKNNRTAERPFERAGISSRNRLKDDPNYIFKKVTFMMNEIANGNGVNVKNYRKNSRRVQYTHLRGYLQNEKDHVSHYCEESLRMLNRLLGDLEGDTWKSVLNYRID